MAEVTGVMYETVRQINNRPMMLFTLAFVMGEMASYAPVVSAGALAIAAAILFVLRRRMILPVTAIVAAGVVLGFLRLSAMQAVPPDDISRVARTEPLVTVTGRVIGEPVVRHGVMTFVVQVQKMRYRNQEARASGDIWVAVATEEAAYRRLPEYGEQVSARGRLGVPSSPRNPGGFSWGNYLACRGIRSLLRVRLPSDIDITDAGPSLERGVVQTRRRLIAALVNATPQTSASILAGILCGARAELPPDLMADFIHTGTVHILASAGLHVGIIAYWLFTAFRALTLHRKAAAALAIVLLILYAELAGGRPSVTRAVIMACVYFGSLLFEREADLSTSIAVAALIILCLNPADLFEEGFLLSFCTVIFLTATMPVWGNLWRESVVHRIELRRVSRVVHWAGELLGLSILAQAGAAPIVAAFNSEASLSGVPANLCVVPLLFVLIPLGFAGAALSAVWPAAGAAVLGIAGWGVRMVETTVRWFAHGVSGYQAVAPPGPVMIGLYYIVLIAAIRIAGARFGGREPRSHHNTGLFEPIRGAI